MKLITKKYVMKTKNDYKRLGVQYLTATQEGHDDFVKNVVNNDDVMQLCSMYEHEIDLSQVDRVITHINKEEEKNNET